MSVPQWNAEIITPDNEASAEIISGGGLVKDETGAVGVSVDGETIVINNDGELQANGGGMPYNLFKCRYSAGTAPTGTGLIATWNDTESSDNIWYVACFDNAGNLFKNDTGIVEVMDANIQLPLRGIASMFEGCSALTSVPLFDLSSATNTTKMFQYCRSLTSVPLFDLSSATTTTQMFNDCSALTSVPLFNLSSATNTTKMFNGCTAVETGALALYQQVSSQATPPSTHSSMFTNCGANTTTGAAELAQIPSSWGGTGA